MIGTIEGKGIRATRDRAIRALGMAGAFRRSEIADMQLEALQFVPSGLRLTIPRSKRDQEALGQVIAIPESRFIRPVGLLRIWFEAAGLNESNSVTWERREGHVFWRLTQSDGVTGDPIFDKTVARLVKATVAAAGLDPSTYSGHSLRRLSDRGGRQAG